LLGFNQFALAKSFTAYQYQLIKASSASAKRLIQSSFDCNVSITCFGVLAILFLVGLTMGIGENLYIAPPPTVSLNKKQILLSAIYLVIIEITL
jgi:hypothetical protein